MFHLICYIYSSVKPYFTSFLHHKSREGVYRNQFVCPSVCSDSCPAHNFFLVWLSLTIFGTWVYHYKTMCRAHSWSWYDIDIWPQGQICSVFDMISCPAYNYLFLFDIGSPYLAHGPHHEHVDLLPQGQIYRIFDMFISSP